MNNIYKIKEIMKEPGIKSKLYSILSLAYETKELELKVNKTPFIDNYKKTQYEIETEYSNAIENIGEYKYNKEQWKNLNNANKYIVRTYDDPLDIYELLDIHKILFSGHKDAGIFKSAENAIAGHKTSLVSNVEKDMNQIIHNYYSVDKSQLDTSLIASIMLTLNFLIVHPFQDGNGRMSRLLLHKLIVKSGLSFIKYQSLSQYIHASKEDYYDSLERVRRGILDNPGTFDNDNSIPYIEYVLTIIIKAITGLKEQLKLHDEIGKDNKLFKEWIIKEVASNGGVTRKYFYTKLSLIMTQDKIYRIISEVVKEKRLRSDGHKLFVVV